MGKGKSKRRRQKNYDEAHKSGVALAQPPAMKDVNAIPNKLRTIMKFMESQQKSTQGKVKAAPGNAEKDAETPPVMKHSTAETPPPTEKSSEAKSKSDSKKRALEEFAQTLKAESVGHKGRERRKKYLMEKKEKKQQKHAKDGLLQELLKRDEVKFGEVAQAPPKLPRLLHKDKGTGMAVISQERRRLQAVEAYRMKKDWQSRPGRDLTQN